MKKKTKKQPVIPIEKSFGKVDKTLMATNGWISPDGVLYACKYWEHIDLAIFLVRKLKLNESESEERVLEKAGWIKLQMSNFDSRALFYRWIGFENDYEVTQKQFDIIFDWCQLHKQKMHSRFKVKE